MVARQAGASIAAIHAPLFQFHSPPLLSPKLLVVDPLRNERKSVRLSLRKIATFRMELYTPGSMMTGQVSWTARNGLPSQCATVNDIDSNAVCKSNRALYMYVYYHTPHTVLLHSVSLVGRVLYTDCLLGGAVCLSTHDLLKRLTAAEESSSFAAPAVLVGQHGIHGTL